MNIETLQPVNNQARHFLTNGKEVFTIARAIREDLSL